MSSSLSMLSMLALVLILVDPSLAHKHNDHKHNKLKKVCSKTDDKNLCLDLMKTDSSYSEDVDYKTLTEIAIDLAYKKAQDIARDLSPVVDYVNHDDANVVNYRCYKDYNDVADVLSQMKDTFGGGHREYKHLEDQVKYAIQEVRDCKDELKRNGNNGYELNRRTKEFEILCDVIKHSGKYWKHDN